MMQKLCLACLLLAIFSAEFVFAVSKKNCSYFLRAAVSPETLSSEEQAIAEINKIRQEHDLNPLKPWSNLSDCAREHSQNMASEKCSFGHEGFKQRQEEMHKTARLRSFAENVAYSFNYNDPIKIAVDGWMKSPSHRKNILGDYEETGMGIALSEDGSFYITQLFAKRHSSYTPSKKLVSR